MKRCCSPGAGLFQVFLVVVAGFVLIDGRSWRLPGQLTDTEPVAHRRHSSADPGAGQAPPGVSSPDQAAAWQPIDTRATIRHRFGSRRDGKRCRRLELPRGIDEQVWPRLLAAIRQHGRMSWWKTDAHSPGRTLNASCHLEPPAFTSLLPAAQDPVPELLFIECRRPTVVPYLRVLGVLSALPAFFKASIISRPAHRHRVIRVTVEGPHRDRARCPSPCSSRPPRRCRTHAANSSGRARRVERRTHPSTSR